MTRKKHTSRTTRVSRAARPAVERTRPGQSLDLPHAKRLLRAMEQELTRNKKVLAGLKPPWEHEEPVWELRVGKYRVFYDVNEVDQRVMIRAVRAKPPHRTTEEIL